MSDHDGLETSVRHLSTIANMLLRVVSLQDAIISEYHGSDWNLDQIGSWQLQVDEITAQLPIHFPSADEGWQWNQPPTETT